MEGHTESTTSREGFKDAYLSSPCERPLSRGRSLFLGPSAAAPHGGGRAIRLPVEASGFRWGGGVDACLEFGGERLGVIGTDVATVADEEGRR